MKLSRSLLMCIAFAGVAALPGCRPAPDDSEGDDSPSTPAQVRVATATITTLKPSIDLIGTVTAIPERTAEVSTQTEGVVARVAALEGQVVHAGDLLIQLDDRLAKAKLAAAHAAEQRAEAALDKLRNGPREEELEEARQTALQLSAIVQSASAKLEALHPLHEKGDVSDVEFNQAEARLEAAKAESAAAEARVKLLEAGARSEDIAAAEAESASARADVAAAELVLEYCSVTTPIDGVVTGLAARLGAAVSPTDRIAVIIDTSEVFVRVRIPSARLQQVRSSAPADIWIGSGADAIRGSVLRLSPLADENSGDLDAFVVVSNADGVLRPGISCRTRIWLPELADALVVPIAAVADRDGEAVVTLVRENEAHESPVRLGVSARDYVQVLDGLVDGDIVAVEGGYGLPDGCPVQVAPSAGG